MSSEEGSECSGCSNRERIRRPRNVFMGRDTSPTSSEEEINELMPTEHRWGRHHYTKKSDLRLKRIIFVKENAETSGDVSSAPVGCPVEIQSDEQEKNETVSAPTDIEKGNEDRWRVAEMQMQETTNGNSECSMTCGMFIQTVILISVLLGFTLLFIYLGRQKK